MLHNVKASHGDILRGLPELDLLPPPNARNKALLRDMAKRGDPRPSQKTRIGRSLSDYTSPSNRSYDPDFHREMKRLRPDWFVTQTEAATQKKKELMRMAREGEPRPSHDGTRLGQALSNYTRKSSQVYDRKFHLALLKIRPDWFQHARTQ